MTFVVEDGTGLATANSYESTANADQYHVDRGNSDWSDVTLTKRETALVQATDYIDSHRIKNQNCPFKTDQALKFPIIGSGEKQQNDPDDSEKITGYDIPDGIRKACSEYALEVIKGNTLQPTPEHTNQRVQSQKRKLGPIEKEDRFSTLGSIRTKALFPKADRFLAPYTVSGRRTIT